MNISACPAGWDLVQSPRGRMCYKISSSTANWEAAGTACKGEGGDLANIENQEEAVSFCAKIRTGSRDSVNALTYLWHTMGLS